jgi:Uma2 family endonuclease
MSVVAKTKPVTAEEFLRVAHGDQMLELVRGEVIEVTGASFESSQIGVWIASLLATYVRPRGLGTLLGADGGFVLARRPDTVRIPDAGFVSQERTRHAHPHRFFPGAPDLAVEVLSPSDRPTEAHEKCLEYLAAGAKLVWLVFPETRRIHVYRSPEGIEVLTEEDMLTAEPVIPGFSCPVAEVFSS